MASSIVSIVFFSEQRIKNRWVTFLLFFWGEMAVTVCSEATGSAMKVNHSLEDSGSLDCIEYLGLINNGSIFDLKENQKMSQSKRG